LGERLRLRLLLLLLRVLARRSLLRLLLLLLLLLWRHRSLRLSRDLLRRSFCLSLDLLRLRLLLRLRCRRLLVCLSRFLSSDRLHDGLQSILSAKHQGIARIVSICVTAVAQHTVCRPCRNRKSDTLPGLLRPAAKHQGIVASLVS
jgi:hypothetical protein